MWASKTKLFLQNYLFIANLFCMKKFEDYGEIHCLAVVNMKKSIALLQLEKTTRDSSWVLQQED